MQKESIFDFDGKTFVAFGSGTIQMGVATDDAGQAMVYLSDVMRENPIGLDLSKWEEAKGRQIVLGFNKIESIDVLMKTLTEAKEWIIKLNNKR